MRKFVPGLAAYLAVLVALTVVLTYPAWMAARASGLEDVEFQRVFNRVLMLGALGGLFPLARYWGLGWRDLGWGSGRGRLWDAGGGFVAGLAMIALIAGIYGLSGHRAWNPEWTVGKGVGHLLSAGAVAVAEEVIFRGFFFLAVCAVVVRGRPLAVALLGSAVFASVHFFIDVHDATQAPGWGSAWALWREWAALFLQPERFFTRWLSLFLAGLVLCALVRRQGHVWGAVAVHAGWVFAIKTVHRLTDHQGGETLWVAADLISGLPASLLLAAAWLVLWRNPREPLARRAD